MPVFHHTIPSKLPLVGTTIFTVMSKLANENNAINLSQGFPDFDCDRVLLDLVHHHMLKGHNQYAPMQGLPVLREVIAAKFASLYGVHYDADKEITVTAGGTQALYSTISALIHEGDEAIIFTPAYDSYEPAIQLHKGIVHQIPLEGDDFHINWEKVRATITSKTKLIVVNTPHNPTGSILTANDLDSLAQAVKGTNIVVLSDEVYEHIVFDGEKHFSLCTHPELAQRTVIVASFGKVFHITGWKMGYMVGPENLMHEIRKAHQYQVFCVNTPVQHALAEYMKLPENYLGLNDFYQEKRDYFLNGIRSSRFTFKPSKGTYFQLLDYSAISNENDVDFAKRLTIEHKLASIPISVFYAVPPKQQYLRFCFAKKKETLDKAISIINQIG